MKFSVIIPVYNAEKTIDAAIESVLAQTHQDFEIICVNDGSTDDSAERLAKWEKNDKRITICRLTRNRGTFGARVEALRLVKSDYVLFLDADDMLFPHCLEVLNRVTGLNNADIVSYGVQAVFSDRVDEATRIAVINNMRVCTDELKGTQILQSCFVEHKYRHSLLNKAFSSMLMSRVSLPELQIDITQYEDYYLYFLLSRKAETYAGIEDVLYKYNFGEGISAGYTVTAEKALKYCTGKQAFDAVRKLATEMEIIGLLKPKLDLEEHACLHESVRRLLVAEDMTLDVCSKVISVWGSERVCDVMALFPDDMLNRHMVELVCEIGDDKDVVVRKLLSEVKTQKDAIQSLETTMANMLAKKDKHIKLLEAELDQHKHSLMDAANIVNELSSAKLYKLWCIAAEIKAKIKRMPQSEGRFEPFGLLKKTINLR